MEVSDLKISNDERKKAIQAYLSGLILDNDIVERINGIFNEEMEKGLEGGLENSSLQMENTFLPELLNGSEEGLFMALDLGGTNFRVLALEMEKGNKIIHERVQYYSIPENLRLGKGIDLFDFLADCIKDFLEKEKHTDRVIPLGFTFSFPMTQKALNSGYLVTWTKSFNCPDVVGADAARLLQESLDRKLIGDKISVVAILNDTTGTLVRGCCSDSDTAIGLILATGCNGAYLEHGKNIKRWGNAVKTDVVVMDPEFGACGDNGCIDFVKTEFDVQVDKSSLLPGSFTYEKYLSGKYLGDLFRFILTGLVRKGYLFADMKNPEEVIQLLDQKENNEYLLNTVDLSTIESDPEIQGVIKFLNKLGFENTMTDDDYWIIRWVAELLSDRAALLVSIPLSIFIKRIDRKSRNVTISVTGSLYKYHPRIKTLMENYISKLAPNYPFKFHLIDDGSGKGAGIVAAIADRLRRN